MLDTYVLRGVVGISVEQSGSAVWNCEGGRHVLKFKEANALVSEWLSSFVPW